MRFASLRSLRGRLAVGTMVLLVAAIALADFTAYVGLDRQLADRRMAILDLTLQRGLTLARTPGIDWNQARLERLLPPYSYVALYDPAGRMLIERAPGNIAGLPPMTVPPIGALPAGPSLVTAPGDNAGLVLLPEVLPVGQQPPILVMGQERTLGGVVAGISNVDDLATLRNLVLVQVVAGLAIVVLAIAVMWLVLRFSLRPLRDVADTAGEISAGDLSRRIPVADPGTEIGAVSIALNEAFDHVEQSEARMRTFVANASHELRTPLTTIHGWADLYLHHGMHEWGEVDLAMNRIRLESTRMNDLVEQLLTLARLDAQPPSERELVDLTALCADVIADLQVSAPGHLVQMVPGEAQVVQGDPTTLRQAVVNLIGNAVRHTPAGSTVTVKVMGSDDDSVLVIVRDDGPGLSGDELERAFDRFWRADPGRGPTGGTGLGLSIVRSIALMHGGTATLDSAPGEGLTVTLRLPAGG